MVDTGDPVPPRSTRRAYNEHGVKVEEGCVLPLPPAPYPNTL